MSLVWMLTCLSFAFMLRDASAFAPVAVNIASRVSPLSLAPLVARKQVGAAQTRYAPVRAKSSVQVRRKASGSKQLFHQQQFQHPHDIVEVSHTSIFSLGFYGALAMVLGLIFNHLYKQQQLFSTLRAETASPREKLPLLHLSKEREGGRAARFAACAVTSEGDKMGEGERKGEYDDLPTMSAEEFLDQMSLAEMYSEAFKAKGIVSLNQIMQLEDADFTAMGVILAHRMHMIQRVEQIKRALLREEGEVLEDDLEEDIIVQKLGEVENLADVIEEVKAEDSGSLRREVIESVEQEVAENVRDVIAKAKTEHADEVRKAIDKARESLDKLGVVMDGDR